MAADILDRTGIFQDGVVFTVIIFISVFLINIILIIILFLAILRQEINIILNVILVGLNIDIDIIVDIDITYLIRNILLHLVHIPLARDMGAGRGLIPLLTFNGFFTSR